MKALSAAVLILCACLAAAPRPTSDGHRAIAKTFVNDWPVAIKVEIKAGDNRPCTENRTVKEVELAPRASVVVEIDPGDCVCYRRTANPGKSADLQLVWTESCSAAPETIRL